MSTLVAGTALRIWQMAFPDALRQGRVQREQNFQTVLRRHDEAAANDLKRAVGVFFWRQSVHLSFLRLFAMKYSSGTSTGAVNMEIKLPAISAIASP